MKLSRRIDAMISERLADPNADGWKSVWKALDAAILEVDHPDNSLTDAYKENSQYRSLTDCEWKIVKFSNAHGLSAESALDDGLCRRLWKNDPEEFALRLAVGSRFEWISVQTIRCNHFDDIWRNVLQASAAHDWIAVESLISLWKNSGEKPNNRAYDAICKALSAVFHADTQQLADALTDMKKRKSPGYVSAINAVIESVHLEDVIAFSDSLNLMLKRYKEYVYGDSFVGLVDPHAIGLYELLFKLKPQFCSTFDVKRSFPWDSEYFEWIRQVPDITTKFAIPSGPEWLLTSLFKLEPFAWSRVVRSSS